MTFTPEWQQISWPPLPPRGGVVTVWRVPLEMPAAALDDCVRILDHAERERADRFRFPRDRRRFIVSHVALRTILGICLDVPPADLRFTTGPYGKPALDAATAAPLHFNLSHAHELALIAVATRAVGIDLVFHDPTVDYADLAPTFCTPAELSAINHDPRAALRYWACKEAYLKALGTGCAISPATIEIVSSPLTTHCTTIANDPTWVMQTFTPAPDYFAAVALAGDGWGIAYRDWEVETPNWGCCIRR